MSNTTTRLPSTADHAVSVGVPLIVIAALCAIGGVGVGSVPTILAASIAAALATVFQHFGSGMVRKLSGDQRGGLRFYALLGGVNAVLTALSMLAVSATIGF